MLGSPTTLVILLLLLFGLGSVRKIAGWILDYQWWKEVGQLETLLNTITYGVTPVVLAGIVAFALFWAAHARGMKAAGTSLRRHPGYSRIANLALLVLAYIVASASVDPWTAVLYFGGAQLAADSSAWRDPVFQHPLAFYLFQLPFYRLLLRVLLVVSLVSGLIFLLTRLLWSARLRGPIITEAGGIEFEELEWRSGLDATFLRAAGAVFLLALAVERWLSRYALLTTDHQFMVGIDFVDERVRLPLLLLGAGACLAAALLLWLRKWGFALAAVVLPVVLGAVLPILVQAIYVRPNEISIQRPYIERHIQATRAAFGLDRRSKEVEYKAKLEAPVDPVKNKLLFDNVRLWDWRAFHDTVTQIQALRPYYVFKDTDVDRYRIDGQLRQVMLTPRELDVSQLSADARSRWMNPHFIYTHGYGLVMAEASRITSDGLPVLFIQNAPPEVKTTSLKLTRPEIYYGEQVHEPVFVRTGQQEFNYPSGSENVHTRYEGKGGFPISAFPMRLAAALARADWNIVLTGFLTSESRMMLRRNVRERVTELAEFLIWENDPYLVITEDGRLVWIIDGYTASDAHPYSRHVGIQGGPRLNYIRNSVKATVDAYDGSVIFYVFDPSDPIIQAYWKLFPKLFQPESQMPADLRAHARYPEFLFRIQAEMYRNFHMRDPEAFYNKEDSWDIARSLVSRDGRPESVTPTYVVATLPGETKPEFLLMIPFTPRNKDNLIGIMVARCDGEKLGELVFLQLSKQELIFGPMQIDARINQDQNISKDLSLWNQQGSQVLRGQMLVLPVDGTFVYIEPIYIQASEARMPQLKKVAVALGNNLIYADTYEQALAELTRLRPQTPVEVTQMAPPAPVPSAPAPVSPSSDAERRLDQIRRHMQRYRELASQGKWAEAGRELEALEAAAKR
ncbi:MAG: UPF0182 family protein [Bryobacteraceae bacterium]|nr:UPF0182 family protein [Bryobacteraceae bacterium]MDW8378701.1 UPF0182 family protein [Bryobacterales bacterium]